MNVKNQFHYKEDCNKKKKETQYQSFLLRVEMLARTPKKHCDTKCDQYITCEWD